MGHGIVAVIAVTLVTLIATRNGRLTKAEEEGKDDEALPPPDAG